MATKAAVARKAADKRAVKARAKLKVVPDAKAKAAKAPQVAVVMGHGMPPDYQAVGLSKRFGHLIELRQQYKAEIDRLKTLVESDDPDNPGLNIQIELVMSEKDLKSVTVDDFVVSLCNGKNVTIPRERLQQRLLDGGMDAEEVNEVIKDATNTTQYTYIQVQSQKRSR